MKKSAKSPRSKAQESAQPISTEFRLEFGETEILYSPTVQGIGN